MRADDLLNELSYKQNIGAMETYKFYSVATPEQKYELKRLIAEKNFKEAWRLIKQVTGLELQDLGTESTITDYERAVMEGGHSIEEPARRSALHEAVVSELTGWKQSQPQSVIQKRSIKIPSNLTKDKDTRSELQKRKDSGNKNWFRIKEDDVAEEELEEDWKSTAASLAAAAGIAGAGYSGMAAKQSVGNYFKEPTAATQQVKSPTPKIDTTKLQVKKQEQPQVKQPEVKPQVKKSQDVKPITNNPLESKLLAIAKQSGLAGAELAAFMAQCAHETLDFKRMVEFGGKLDFKKYDPKHAPKKAKALGNKHAGDGERYKGRGFIQITGRYNYKKAGEELGLPLEQKPQLVEDPEIAAKVAVWFWKHRVQPNVDNFHDVVDVTKYINPAMRGLKDRKENFKEYMSAAQQQGRSV